MRVRSMNPFVASSRANSSRANSSPPIPPVAVEEKPPAAESRKFDIKKIISELKTDDYILIGLIAVLFFEGCDDYILLAALGYLFVMGIL